MNAIAIEAVPAYNTTPDRLQYHPQGRDNGYVLTVGGQRVYIAGDTEDTPEMRALSGIDIAFLPMNLPYTMAIEQAADAVAAFRPGGSIRTTTARATSRPSPGWSPRAAAAARWCCATGTRSRAEARRAGRGQSGLDRLRHAVAGAGQRSCSSGPVITVVATAMITSMVKTCCGMKPSE